MKHTPQDILEYLHWPENNFGDYFWDLRELVMAEIARQKRHANGYIPDEDEFWTDCGYCGTTVLRSETECSNCHEKIDWDGYDNR